MSRRICVVTGTRADYGILFPVMKAINSTPGLNLQIVVTSMHLMREFGKTINEIKRGGFTIAAKVDISYKDDTLLAMADSTGRAVSGLAKTFNRLTPDIVVVLGDRGEMLAASIAANYLNIPVAHIHGGEISGHIDGVFRHAITKISHIHFPATREARNRIVKLGEDPWRIFVSGAPALDNIVNENMPSKEIVFGKYKLSLSKPLLLVIQHPLSSQIDKNEKCMKITLDAVKRFKTQTIIIYPNADAGGRGIMKVINKYSDVDFMKIFKSIPHEDFLSLLKYASVLIGNSSSGIIEAPFFSLPVVNIGDRQHGRERGANVIDVPCDQPSIKKAIIKALYDKKFRDVAGRCRTIYGDGHASSRIVKILKTIKLNDKLLQKHITY